MNFQTEFALKSYQNKMYWDGELNPYFSSKLLSWGPKSIAKWFQTPEDLNLYLLKVSDDYQIPIEDLNSEIDGLHVIHRTVIAL